MKYKEIYRRLSLLSLVIVLLVQTFPETLVLIDYSLNTSKFIALCINKDNPEMHCDGTCQMDDMLKNVQHDHKKNSNRQIEYHTSVYFLKEIVTIKKPNLKAIQPKPLGYLPSFNVELFQHSIFKPPGLIS